MISIYYQPSIGSPRYTIDTSVFPYTADTVGYNFLPGRPGNGLHFMKRMTHKNTWNLVI